MEKDLEFLKHLRHTLNEALEDLIDRELNRDEGSERRALANLGSLSENINFRIGLIEKYIDNEKDKDQHKDNEAEDVFIKAVKRLYELKKQFGVEV